MHKHRHRHTAHSKSTRTRSFSPGLAEAEPAGKLPDGVLEELLPWGGGGGPNRTRRRDKASPAGAIVSGGQEGWERTGADAVLEPSRRRATAPPPWRRRAAAPLRWWPRVADAYDGTSTTALVGVGAAEQSRSSRVMDFINLGLLLGWENGPKKNNLGSSLGCL